MKQLLILSVFLLVACASPQPQLSGVFLCEDEQGNTFHSYSIQENRGKCVLEHPDEVGP